MCVFYGPNSSSSCSNAKMFFSNNFLFLMSLAMISWVLLCYLNEIDESRQLSYQLKYRYHGNVSERSLEDDLLTEIPTFQSNYHTFLTFFCVLTGSLLLVRFVVWTEKSCYAHLRTSFNEFQKKISGSFGDYSWQPKLRKSFHAINVSKETFTLDDYRKLSDSLHEQIIKLQQRNSFLESRIRALEQQNLLLMGKGLLRTHSSANFLCDDHGNIILQTGNLSSKSTDDTYNNEEHHHHGGNVCNNEICAGIVYSFLNENDEMDEAASDMSIEQDGTYMENGQLVPVTLKRRSRRRNIFIANRFFHLNRQVYVMEGNVKLLFKDIDCGDFSQMWQKYFELQRISRSQQRQSSSTTNLPKTDSLSTDASRETIRTTATNSSSDVTQNAYTTAEEESNYDVCESTSDKTSESHHRLTKIVSTEQFEAIHGLVH